MSDEIPFGPGNPTGGYGLNDLRSLPSSTGSARLCYCQKCQEKNGWPESLSLTSGPCEVCGDNAICYDGQVPSPKSAKNEILNAINRLETVAQRCRGTMRGKEWTRRDHDADIISLEVIPALRRAILVMPNSV